MQLVLLSGDLGPKWFHVALRAMVLLAKSDENLSSRRLAEALDVENTYIRKIMTSLIDRVLIVTSSGRYGGYALSRPAEQITVLDVYQAMVKTPPTGYNSVAQTGAERMIALILTKAEKQFQSALAEFTIKELADRATLTP